MKINILGTGDAWSLKNYNTCFTLSVNEEHFLVDCGGGNVFVPDDLEEFRIEF